METIVWCIIVEIIIGVFFSFLIYIEGRREALGAMAKWWTCVKILFMLSFAVILYAVWGGIFWW